MTKEYEILVLKTGVMLPIVEKFADETKQREAQLDMMAAAIAINGKPIGREAVEDLDFPEYMELLPKVMDKNKIERADNSGNSGAANP